MYGGVKKSKKQMKKKPHNFLSSDEFAIVWTNKFFVYKKKNPAYFKD